MTWSGVPWFVGGGAAVQVEVARALVYSMTGGKEGVGLPTDLKVTPFAVPGAGVRASSGTCTLLNRYPGGNGSQSYQGLNLSDDPVVIPSTAGSPRSDLIVVRVIDPQYGGTTPDSIADGPYISTVVIPNVPAATTSAAQLALGYPAYALARIDIPASTSTITAAMIKDLRNLVSPRTERQLYTVQWVGSYKVGSAGAIYGLWVGDPNNFQSGIPIPSWATKVVARYDIGQGFIGSSTAVPVVGYTTGHGRGRIGAIGGTVGVNMLVTADTGFRWDSNPTIGVRSSTGFADTLAIPAAMRGTLQHVGVDAYYSSGQGFAWVDYNSYGVYDFQFGEGVV